MWTFLSFVNLVNDSAHSLPPCWSITSCFILKGWECFPVQSIFDKHNTCGQEPESLLRCQLSYEQQRSFALAIILFPTNASRFFRQFHLLDWSASTIHSPISDRLTRDIFQATYCIIAQSDGESRTALESSPSAHPVQSNHCVYLITDHWSHLTCVPTLLSYPST